MKRQRRKAEHYVNNADFSQRVVDYVSIVNVVREKYLADFNSILTEQFGPEAKQLTWDELFKSKPKKVAELSGLDEDDIPIIRLPIVPDYIADCFMRIAEGLSHLPNFIRYSYRDEMVMDAVENCLKAVENYNINAATRTGKPNAFSYFTQISYFAFLRRIDKEKKQQDIKMKYMSSAGVDMFMVNETGDASSNNSVTNYINTLRARIDDIGDKDTIEDQIEAEEAAPTKAKSSQLAEANLEEFIIDDK